VIPERVAAVRERILRAAARAHRDPAEITLVAISKTQPAEALRQAFAAGLVDFGENRVQEAEGKVAALADLRGRIRWHLVGHLQSNKARRVLPFADLIHSVDSFELAQRLDRVAEEPGREARVLVQVDLAGESTKNGLPVAELMPTLAALRELPRLRVQGLMLLPPYEEEPERVRPFFRQLRELRDEALARGLLAG
jgi:pyridoxal phosphate enzyme (YggS family)